MYLATGTNRVFMFPKRLCFVHRNVGIDMPFCHHIYSDYRLGEDSEAAGEKVVILILVAIKFNINK